MQEDIRKSKETAIKKLQEKMRSSKLTWWDAKSVEQIVEHNRVYMGNFSEDVQLEIAKELKTHGGLVIDAVDVVVHKQIWYQPLIDEGVMS